MNKTVFVHKTLYHGPVSISPENPLAIVDSKGTLVALLSEGFELFAKSFAEYLNQYLQRPAEIKIEVEEDVVKGKGFVNDGSLTNKELYHL